MERVWKPIWNCRIFLFYGFKKIYFRAITAALYSPCCYFFEAHFSIFVTSALRRGHCKLKLCTLIHKEGNSRNLICSWIGHIRQSRKRIFNYTRHFFSSFCFMRREYCVTICGRQARTQDFVSRANYTIYWFGSNEWHKKRVFTLLIYRHPALRSFVNFFIKLNYLKLRVTKLAPNVGPTFL